LRLTDLSYQDWLEHAFGREVCIQQAAWFFDHDCDWWDPEPAVAVWLISRDCSSARSQRCAGIRTAKLGRG
jgi:hypothetical protein